MFGHGGTIAEIGVQYGMYFGVLMKAQPALAYAVDAWELATLPGQNDGLVDLLDARMQFIARYGANEGVKVVHAYSVPASLVVAPGSLDLCYIDADHTYEAVKCDLAAWWPKVKSGGIFAGHDYTQYEVIAPSGATFGVKQAVDEFAAEHGLKVYLTQDGLYQSWIILKP